MISAFVLATVLLGQGDSVVYRAINVGPEYYRELVPVELYPGWHMRIWAINGILPGAEIVTRSGYATIVTFNYAGGLPYARCGKDVNGRVRYSNTLTEAALPTVPISVSQPTPCPPCPPCNVGSLEKDLLDLKAKVKQLEAIESDSTQQRLQKLEEASKVPVPDSAKDIADIRAKMLEWESRMLAKPKSQVSVESTPQVPTPSLNSGASLEPNDLRRPSEVR